MARADFDPAERLVAYHGAIDRLDFVAIGTMLAADAVYLSNGVGSLKGRDAIVEAFRDYFARYRHEESVDTQIETIGPREVRSHWKLKARDGEGGGFVHRKGTETIWFGDNGEILTVIVNDS